MLDWHLGFETVEPWPLERNDAGVNNYSPLPNGASPKTILRADKERGIIRLDEQTTLAGVPDEAWWYELGSRSALEWVLDQYKERRPRDPTIRERFSAYRFADHKERVVELLGRVCAVSVETERIVGELDLRTEIDPDEGLELRPEVLAEILQDELEAKAAGRFTIPDAEIAKLGEIVRGYGLD